MQISRILILVLSAFGLVSPSLAGMKSDLSNCIAADRPASAAACTRVINSGRLPRNQFYIGYFNRGSAYQNAGKSKRALADFNRVVNRRPKFARGYFARALAQYDLGAWDKSIADFDRYIELEPDGWSGYYNRALVYRRKNEPDRALADLDKAASMKPDSHHIPLVRALVLSDKGQHAAAKDAITKLIAADRDTAAGYYARAVVAFREHQLDATTADLQKALAIEENFTAAHTLMGRVQEARGKVSDARASYHRAVDSSAKLFDGHPAQQLARERLSGISGKGRSDVALKTESSNSGCRRFLPTAGITVPYDCSEQ